MTEVISQAQVELPGANIGKRNLRKFLEGRSEDELFQIADGLMAKVNALEPGKEKRRLFYVTAEVMGYGLEKLGMDWS